MERHEKTQLARLMRADKARGMAFMAEGACRATPHQLQMAYWISGRPKPELSEEGCVMPENREA